jgi:hypothetical protein
MIEHIHKDVCMGTYNKYGEGIETSQYAIDFDVEYEELTPMCKDLLETIKDKECFVFYLTIPIPTGLGGYQIENRYFDMQYISKITFKEYYLTIDNFKVFYNAIMDFGEAKRW